MLLFGSMRASDMSSQLIEVNKFWAYESTALSQYTNAHCELNATEMIQLHLNLVYRELSSRDISHLSSVEQERRRESLGHLQFYATRGLFPENLTHSARRPMFIDHRGVHCAVGYLISASGHSDLSNRISANMNTHYLMDMDDDRLVSWVAESGFTLEELAWIQPGYPFPVNWDQMKGGTNGPVLCIAADDNMGGIYVGGSFDTAGGFQAGNMAHYFSGFAGFDWMSLNGSATDGRVNKIMVHNNEIIVAGIFFNIDTIMTNSAVVKWNGSSWESLGQFYIGALVNYVNDLIIYRDTLYAGGFFKSDFSTPEFFSGVAKWDGQQWVRAYKDTSSASILQGEVNSLQVHDGRLIVAGAFNLADTAFSQNIFAINGNTPEFFKKDIPIAVNDLEVYEGELYAATKYIDPFSQDSAGLVRWRNDDWELLLDASFYSAEVEIKTLKATPHGLIFGGDFDIVSMISYGSNLGAYVAPAGQPAYFRPLGILDSTVTALEFENDNLYVGGYFKTGFDAGLVPLGHITRMRLTDYLGTSEMELASFKIYPNPSQDYLVIDMPEEYKSMEVQVFDIGGRAYPCQIEKIQSNQVKLETGHLPNGTYLLHVRAGDSIMAEQLVISH